MGGWMHAWMCYLKLATYTRIRNKKYMPMDILVTVIVSYAIRPEK